MVWVITLAVFLVTFAAGVLLPFLFSQRGVLREPETNGESDSVPS